MASGVGEPLWALVLNTNSLTPHVGELGCSKLPTTAGSPLVHMGSLPTMLREGRVGAQRQVGPAGVCIFDRAI